MTNTMEDFINIYVRRIITRRVIKKCKRLVIDILLKMAAAQS